MISLASSSSRPPSKTPAQISRPGAKTTTAPATGLELNATQTQIKFPSSPLMVFSLSGNLGLGLFQLHSLRRLSLSRNQSLRRPKRRPSTPA
ncbi:hypothetical protein KSP39_PZI017656 [Platanthera zijinensis]|uniref:Uncharacterized protein n=1 Tax=Platanthera zijinensis TaxID=2320716 RepID=A0AAP0G017_9ASPA